MQNYDSENNAIDYKTTKVHYPHQNDQKFLHFILEKDPNLFLRKNKISIRGTISINENYVPCTGWTGKLFSQLSVEVNSQEVSKNIDT